MFEIVAVVRPIVGIVTICRYERRPKIKVHVLLAIEVGKKRSSEGYVPHSARISIVITVQ